MDDTISNLLVEIIGNSPVFGLLLYMWWGERSERIRLTREYIEKLEELINGRRSAG